VVDVVRYATSCPLGPEKEEGKKEGIMERLELFYRLGLFESLIARVRLGCLTLNMPLRVYRELSETYEQDQAQPPL
jgi:hypothetical protein